MPKRNDESSAPSSRSFARSASPGQATVSHRERAIQQVLESLEIRTEHTASLADLRWFQRAREATAFLVDEFGADVMAFVDRPLEDYGGKSVRELVEMHGVRALEAVRSDIEYPTPA